MLRSARLARGLTLRVLSERTGIAVSNLSRLETGGTDPRASTLIAVLGAMDMTLGLVPGLTIGDVEARMSEGASRLRAVGVTDRGVEARLAWKEARGIDTSVERRMLGL